MLGAGAWASQNLRVAHLREHNANLAGCANEKGARTGAPLEQWLDPDQNGSLPF
jgi:hypothetical protein